MFVLLKWYISSNHCCAGSTNADLRCDRMVLRRFGEGCHMSVKGKLDMGIKSWCEVPLSLLSMKTPSIHLQLTIASIALLHVFGMCQEIVFFFKKNLPGELLKKKRKQFFLPTLQKSHYCWKLTITLLSTGWVLPSLHHKWVNWLKPLCTPSVMCF